MIYGVWYVILEADVEQFEGAFSCSDLALDDAKTRAYDFAEFDPRVSVSIRGAGDGYSIVLTNRLTQSIVEMWSVRPVVVQGAQDEDVKVEGEAPTGPSQSGWAQASSMYNSYLDLRKRILAAIKADAAISDLVSDAPGPGPNGSKSKKDAKVYTAKPQELTPSRVERITKFLEDNGVDLNSI